MKQEVGAYEAKTHLPRLLDEVAAGRRITITKHGKPVALLVPPLSRGRRPIAETIADLKTFRKAVTLGNGNVSIREMIEEGRR